MPLYPHLRPEMKTGDVIAFSGKGRISNLIKLVTQSPYSHVGMVIRTNMEEGLGESVLLVESTTLNTVADAFSGKRVKGVQMHWLSQRLRNYPGEAYWLPLKEAVLQEKIPSMLHWLRTIHKNHVAYDSLQAVGSALDVIDIFGLRNKRGYHTLFCSELVARALQIAGKVPEEINPSECTPQDVVEFSC